MGERTHLDRVLRATRGRYEVAACAAGLHHHFYSVLADINEFAPLCAAAAARSRSKYYAHNRAPYNPSEAELSNTVIN